MAIPVGLLSYTSKLNRQLGPFKPQEGYWLGNQFIFPGATYTPPEPPKKPDDPTKPGDDDNDEEEKKSAAQNAGVYSAVERDGQFGGGMPTEGMGRHDLGGPGRLASGWAMGAGLVGAGLAELGFNSAARALGVTPNAFAGYNANPAYMGEIENQPGYGTTPQVQNRDLPAMPTNPAWSAPGPPTSITPPAPSAPPATGIRGLLGITNRTPQELMDMNKPTEQVPSEELQEDETAPAAPTGKQTSNEYGRTPTEQREYESRLAGYQAALNTAYGALGQPAPVAADLSFKGISDALSAAAQNQVALGLLSLEEIESLPSVNMNNVTPTYSALSPAVGLQPPDEIDDGTGGDKNKTEDSGAGGGRTVGAQEAKAALDAYETKPQVGVPTSIRGMTQIGLAQALRSGMVSIDDGRVPGITTQDEPQGMGKFGDPNEGSRGVDSGIGGLSVGINADLSGTPGDTYGDKGGDFSGSSFGGRGDFGAGDFGDGRDRRTGGPIPKDADDKLEPVPIMAHEGEYVIRPEAVKHYGKGLLSAINERKIDKKRARGLLG